MVALSRDTMGYCLGVMCECYCVFSLLGGEGSNFVGSGEKEVIVLLF
jgi:hypothetical protein